MFGPLVNEVSAMQLTHPTHPAHLDEYVVTREYGTIYLDVGQGYDLQLKHDAREAIEHAAERRP